MSSENRNFNLQILEYFDKVKDPKEFVKNKNIEELLSNEMSSLKFGYPVHSIEELNEVIKLCYLHYNLHHSPEVITNQFRKNAKKYNISLSLTDRCGNSCYHCSTNASLGMDKESVPFSILKERMREMNPHTRFLYISCEGSPYSYISRTGSEINEEEKSIVDVFQLLLDLGYSKISLQSMAPSDNNFNIFEKILDKIETHEENIEFVYQISFNLYSPRAGLKSKNKKNEKGIEFKVLEVPSIEWDEFKTNLRHLLKFSNQIPKKKTEKKVKPEKISQNKLMRLYQSSKSMLNYLNDVKKTIISVAKKGHHIHFEVRGDPYGEFTNLKALKIILETLLNQITKEHPGLDFSGKNKDSRISYSTNFAYIVPLGRAAKLFPNGQEMEKDFFDTHVLMSDDKYLCDNWTSWGSMIIDTKGYPQLCYSNLALTPKARTTDGPNLYRDGFESITEFYLNVWKDRMEFLMKNFPEIVQNRPNPHYCPLNLFKETLNSSKEHNS